NCGGGVLADPGPSPVLTVGQLRIGRDRLSDDLPLLLPRQMPPMQIQRERQPAKLGLITLSRHARAVKIEIAGNLVPVMTVADPAVRPDRTRHLYSVRTDRLLKLRILVRGKPRHDLIAAHDEAPTRISITSGVRWNQSP